MDTENSIEKVEAEIDLYHKKLFQKRNMADESVPSDSVISRDINTSTPLSVKNKQKSIVDMLSFREAKKKKRKFISPVHDSLFLEGTSSESENASDNESTLTGDINKELASILDTMQKGFNSTMAVMTDTMTNNFSSQMKIFTDEIRELIRVSIEKEKDERNKLKDDIVTLKLELQQQNMDIQELRKEIHTLRETSKIQEGRITRSEKELVDTNEDVLQLQARLMKQNLVFYNIKEKDHEDSRETTNILQTFLESELKIPNSLMQSINLDNVHRMGVKKPNNTRPIVAKFQNMTGKFTVLQHAKNLDKSKRFGISEQLPPELHDRKSRLMPKYKEAKEAKLNPKWVGEKLIINKNVVNIQKDKVTDHNYNVDEASITMCPKRAPPIYHQDSSFQSHAVQISSQNDVIPALHSIYSDARVARASHNIYAYRLETINGVVEHYEDDREWGAGKVVLSLLQERNITNKLVCVSRWFGGTHLGRIRFQYIKEEADKVINL